MARSFDKFCHAVAAPKHDAWMNIADILTLIRATGAYMTPETMKIYITENGLK